MAWEISRKSYRFFGTDSDDSFDHMEPTYPFKHNPIHDLESLWWIAIWILTAKAPFGSTYNKDQNAWHWSIFYSQVERHSILTYKAPFLHFIKTLPLPFREVGFRLASLRSSLVNSYQTAERSYEVLDDRPFADSELPKTFVERLAEVVQTCPDVKLDSLQKSPLSVIPQNKRDASSPTSKSNKRLRLSTQNDASTSSLAKRGTGRIQPDIGSQL
jgi:hypothetical protein